MSLLSVNPDWGVLAAAATFVLAVLGLLGAAYKYVLLPNLRAELIEPAQETNRQITGTSTSEEVAGPTLREELGQLREDVGKVTGEVTDAALELAAMAMMFDGHLEWSQVEVDRWQAEVDKLWAELRRRHETGERPAPPRHRGETRHDPNG